MATALQPDRIGVTDLIDSFDVQNAHAVLLGEMCVHATGGAFAGRGAALGIAYRAPRTCRYRSRRRQLSASQHRSRFAAASALVCMRARASASSSRALIARPTASGANGVTTRPTS